MINQKDLEKYEKDGYVVLKNFFPKSRIEKVRLEILKLSKKKGNNHFYYEHLGKKKVLRRIERISQNSNKMKHTLRDNKLKVTLKKGKFAKLNKYWIKISDIKKIQFKNKNIFKDVMFFKNIKYLWGGKSFQGIDCSALVQIFFNYNNKFCPRDSKDQEKYFKKKVKLKNIKKNDIIFWKGHVAIALSRYKLIHAYGPMKKVVIMNIKYTIERIKRTANLDITSIRRF